MHSISSILLFYRPYMVWSFGIGILLLCIGVDIVPLMGAKLVLIVFLWYVISETRAKRKLMFYKNIGISTFKLFSLLYIIDLFCSLPVLLIFKAYV